MYIASFSSLAILASLLQGTSAQSVSGKAPGFASGVTGGGSATPSRPTTIQQLTQFLTDSTPRVIVLDRTFDYTSSEGTESGNVCAPWGTGSACQRIIQVDCAGKPASTETWNKAARTPIDVASDKTILGVGSSGVIKGKGLRFRAGTHNVIVQNIAITDLNPKYVWGGDAISFDTSDRIWIDHVTTARTGRQHYVFGFGANTHITLSNNHLDGQTPYSTSCDGYTYWGLEMVGGGDTITMTGNYLTRTSGRSPALSYKTLLHAVNNVWSDNAGHALEGGEATALGLFEGNAFINIRQTVADYAGRAFAATGANGGMCAAALGRACPGNLFQNSPDMASLSDTAVFASIKGMTIAPAVSAAQAASKVPGNAGYGKI